MSGVCPTFFLTTPKLLNYLSEIISVSIFLEHSFRTVSSTSFGVGRVANPITGSAPGFTKRHPGLSTTLSGFLIHPEHSAGGPFSNEEMRPGILLIFAYCI